MFLDFEKGFVMERYKDQLAVDDAIESQKTLERIARKVGKLVLSIRQPKLKNEIASDVEFGSFQSEDDVVVRFFISQYREDEYAVFPNTYLRMTDEEITVIETEKIIKEKREREAKLVLEEKEVLKKTQEREMKLYEELKKKYGDERPHIADTM